MSHLFPITSLTWRPQKRKNSTLERLTRLIVCTRTLPLVIYVTPQEYQDLHLDLYNSQRIAPICTMHGAQPCLMVLGVPIRIK